MTEYIQYLLVDRFNFENLILGQKLMSTFTRVNSGKVEI